MLLFGFFICLYTKYTVLSDRMALSIIGRGDDEQSSQAIQYNGSWFGSVRVKKCVGYPLALQHSDAPANMRGMCTRVSASAFVCCYPYVH